MSNYFLSRNAPLTQEDFVNVEAHYTYPGGSNTTVRKLRETLRYLSAQGQSQHIKVEVRSDQEANKEEYCFTLAQYQLSVAITTLGATTCHLSEVREPNTLSQLVQMLQQFCPVKLVTTSLVVIKNTLLSAVNHLPSSGSFQLDVIDDSMVMRLHDPRTRTSAKFELLLLHNEPA